MPRFQLMKVCRELHMASFCIGKVTVTNKVMMEDYQLMMTGDAIYSVFPFLEGYC